MQHQALLIFVCFVCLTSDLTGTHALSMTQLLSNLFQDFTSFACGHVHKSWDDVQHSSTLVWDKVVEMFLELESSVTPWLLQRFTDFRMVVKTGIAGMEWLTRGAIHYTGQKVVRGLDGFIKRTDQFEAFIWNSITNFYYFVRSIVYAMFQIRELAAESFVCLCQGFANVMGYIF